MFKKKKFPGRFMRYVVNEKENIDHDQWSCV